VKNFIVVRTKSKEERRRVHTHSISSCDEAPAQSSSGAYDSVCEQRDKPATKSRLERRRVYLGGFILSLSIHASLLLLLLLSIEKNIRPQALPKQSGEIVQATLVDEKQVAAEVSRLAQIKKQKQQADLKKVQEIKELVKIKQQQEEARIAEIKLAKEKEKAKEQAEQQRAALEAKLQKEEALAKAKLLEKEKEEKKKLAQKAKAKAEAAQKILKKEEAKQAEANAKMEAEALEHSKWLTSEIEKYDAMMRHKINQSWLRPPGLPGGLSCELYARLLPDGSVVDPSVKKSSGNLAFDQAAISALQNASPLPVPNDPNLMDEFRQFNFKFTPPEET